MIAEPPVGAARPLSVSDLSARIKLLLESDPHLASVWVRGEVSGCTQPASGHLYWTIKDGGAAVGCVMWKGMAALQAHRPENGRAYLMHGRVTTYAAQGKYQLQVDHLEPAGIGDLYRAFEELRARLQAEGLFDEDRKRPLPAYPRRIGVVTSTTGAVLHDICRVLSGRWRCVEVMVAHTSVQGADAPGEIVAALGAVARCGVDVVIVARGGGSIEDLWAFNDEKVARAIAACPVPVVSGVGHETDVTIADWAADVRAPTPTAAAAMVSPDGNELAIRLDDVRRALEVLAAAMVRERRDRMAVVERRLTLASPTRALAERRRGLDDARGRLRRATAGRLALARADLAGLESRLQALSPQAVLARGFAHVRTADGRTVRRPADVATGDHIAVRVAEGSFGARVTEGQADGLPKEERP